MKKTNIIIKKTSLFSVFNERKILINMIITLAAVLLFFFINYKFIVPPLEHILNQNRIYALSALMAFFLVPIGLYFGIVRKMDPGILGFILLICGFALVIRIAVFDNQSNDYRSFLDHWVYSLRNAPGLSGWRENLGDYNMPYLYLLTIIAKQPMTPLYMIKIFSIFFDFILAYYAARISRTAGFSEKKEIAVFCAVLFFPTVIINGAYWAQCDVIYTAFAAASIYYGLTNRPKLCVAMMALSFSFKLQAIFIIPVLFALLLTKKINLKSIILFPVIFLSALMPALLAGKPFIDAISIYIKQVDQYPRLTLNAPSIYMFIPNADYRFFNLSAVLFAGCAVLAILYYLWLKRDYIDTESILALAFIFSLIIPYLLPKMHERYYFLADIFSLCIFFINAKRWYVPILMIFVSIRAYSPYIFSILDINFKILALIIAVLLAITSMDLIRRIQTNERNALKNQSSSDNVFKSSISRA